MEIRIDHINLTVRDLRESMEWYQNMFRMEFLEGEIEDTTEPWAIVGKDDSMICLYEHRNLKLASETGESPFHRVYHFGIRVLDKNAWEETLKTYPVEVMYGGAYAYPKSLSWYIADPSGHRIEVSFFT